MEDICVSYSGHKILHDSKSKLESRYKVKILMPDLQNNDLCASGETIFVKIIGDRQNIGFVQRFLQRKLDRQKVLKSDNQEQEENNQSVIILNSDLEDDSEKETTRHKNHKRKRRRREAVNTENATSVCEVTSTTNADESVIIIDTPVVEEFIPIAANNQIKLPSSSEKGSGVSIDIVEISSDEEDNVGPAEQQLQILPIPIPFEQQLQIIPNPIFFEQQLQIIPNPIPSEPRLLRPVVIDGSNVARAHGLPQNTYSSKGIKICIDYFLKKGHSQVTAFVPLFRRHCKYGPVITTDPEILEELSKTQHVVFTPSRKLNGKTYSCYDDRFIVELAASNGGVIVSNDNYKDLLDVSPDFSETIRNRLLMYCFVGDKFMIPADPLGPQGPMIDEYLSFPPGTNIES